MNKKAFSFIELITVISVISVLSVIGLRSFQEQGQKNRKTMAQQELTSLMSLIKTAQITDKHFHQYIYQMGYRPKGVLIANIGINASGSAPCCSEYPALGSTNCYPYASGNNDRIPIKKGEKCMSGSKKLFKGLRCSESKGCECELTRSGDLTYTYYNCGNSGLAKATDALAICDDSSYPSNCMWYKNTPDKITSSNFGSCEPANWCDCNSISAGAVSRGFDEKIVLSSSGTLCEE